MSPTKDARARKDVADVCFGFEANRNHLRKRIDRTAGFQKFDMQR